MTNLRQQVDALRSRRDHALRTVKAEKVALREAKEKLSAAEEAQSLVQEVAQQVQQIAHKRIASVVTRALRAVFGEGSYEFKIDFTKKRGKTEAELKFTRDGEDYDPTEETGGGCVDLASFSLRLAALILTRPARRRLLVMDEPFRFVHGEGNRERLAELLLTLSREMGVQIVMATGLEYLKIGKVVEL